MNLPGYYDILYPLGGAIRFFTPTAIFGFLICIPFLHSSRALSVIRLVVLGWVAFVLCYTKFILFPQISLLTLCAQALGATLLLTLQFFSTGLLKQSLSRESC